MTTAVAFESVWDRTISELDAPGLIDRFKMLEQERRHIEAELAELIGEVDRRQVFRDDQHSTVKGWCRALGKWSDGEARARARAARLSHAFSSVAQALACGLLGVAQCHEIARAYSNPRVRDHMVDVIDIFVTNAQLLPYEEFVKLVRQWEALVDFDGAHRSHEASHLGRRASMYLDETSILIQASGGALQGAEMLEIFNRYQQAEYLADWQQARAEHGADATYSQLPRDAGQRAWDALYRIFQDAASTPADAQAPEPVLNIMADVQTFQEALRDFAIELADDDTVVGSDAWLGSRSTDPRWWRCSTTSGIPLPKSALIQAALLGQVRRVIIDDAGVAVDVGRKRRFFTGPMRDAVMMQTGCCVFAGCSRPSGQCAADHTVDHQFGGSTATHNGGPMCNFHNLRKKGGFSVWRDTEGYWHTYRPDGTEIT
jgi:hypothetical protein